MKIESVIIFTDGASRGNPGPAAIGAIIKDEHGQNIALISQQIGQATNNQAEYKAVIAALEEAIRLGARRVTLKTDSELIVRQVNGEYRVKKPALKPLYNRLEELQSHLAEFSISHIPGNDNEEAHNLADRAFHRG